jgi:hypothetical protein
MTKCKKRSMMLPEIERVRGEQLRWTSEAQRFAGSGVQYPGHCIQLFLVAWRSGRCRWFRETPAARRLGKHKRQYATNLLGRVACLQVAGADPTRQFPVAGGAQRAVRPCRHGLAYGPRRHGRRLPPEVGQGRAASLGDPSRFDGVRGTGSRPNDSIPWPSPSG